MSYISSANKDTNRIFSILKSEWTVTKISPARQKRTLNYVPPPPAKYGLSLNIIDLHRQYWDNVVAYAIDKVKRGLTPNPDVMCNKLIKFGCFEQEAGIYTTRQLPDITPVFLKKTGKIWLGTAQDPVKDQTDFLAQIDYLQISKLMFPLGGLMKNEVRDIARIAKLPSAQRKDSQGICFLGKINYNEFLRRFLGEKEGISLKWKQENGLHSQRILVSHHRTAQRIGTRWRTMVCYPQRYRREYHLCLTRL